MGFDIKGTGLHKFWNILSFYIGNEWDSGKLGMGFQVISDILGVQTQILN